MRTFSVMPATSLYVLQMTHYPPLAARMSPFTRSAQGLLRPVISATKGMNSAAVLMLNNQALIALENNACHRTAFAMER
jgi:hypothetical protein